MLSASDEKDPCRARTRQWIAPPALRNSLTGDTQIVKPQRSRIWATRKGQAGIIIVFPTTMEFAQKVKASSNSSTRASGTSFSIRSQLRRDQAQGAMIALRSSSGQKDRSKW